MKRLRLSIVGLGLAAGPHARSLLDLQDRIEVRWAASRSSGRISAFRERFPFPVTTDVGRVIDDPDGDAVLLLTPPATHLELGIRCLAAGKHLLVEKPLALTAREGAELVEAADRAGLRLGVVLQHRFRVAGRRAAAIVRSGALGAIEAATLQVPWWRPQSYYDEPGRGSLARDGGGVLLTQAIHSIDLFRALVGASDVVAAQAVTTGVHRMETEDFASALIRTGNGSPGVIVATTAAHPGRPERIEVIGTRGTLWVEGEGYRLCGLDGTVESHEGGAGSGAGADPMAFSHEAHRLLIADFLDAVDHGREPLASGREALATQELIERILGVARRA
jgi:predicted dehydrogenase